MDAIVDAGSPADSANPYGLTMIERQVVDLLATGMAAREVCLHLSMDRRDVALRRASAMKKLRARNGMHLAHLIATMWPTSNEDVVVVEDIQSAFAFFQYLPQVASE